MLALLAFSKLAIAAFFLFQYTGSPTSLMEGLVVMNRNLEADPLYKRDQPFFSRSESAVSPRNNFPSATVGLRSVFTAASAGFCQKPKSIQSHFL